MFTLLIFSPDGTQVLLLALRCVTVKPTSRYFVPKQRWQTRRTSGRLGEIFVFVNRRPQT